MSASESALDYEYVAYIDESGDPGLERVLPVDPGGASEWFCLSAVVIFKKREAETVEWIQDIRDRAGVTQGPAMHFHRLTPDRKQKVCDFFATKPLRAFVVCSHKVNMRQYQNDRAARISQTNQWFYNWCCRFMLERVSAWVERHSIRTFGGPRLAKIVFAETGNLSYSQTAAYHFLLRQQARSGSTYLQRRQIRPEVLDWRLVDSKPNAQVAGLQIADTFVSAFYQAVDANGKRVWTTDCAERLLPRMAMEGKTWADFGVTLLPFSRSDRAILTDNQRKIFRFYRYAL